MMSDWDDYRYFLAVADTGSLSAAARRLDTTQPTVGRRIKALEKRLRMVLFERSGHGYVLTPVGKDIHEPATRMQQRALAVEERVAGVDAQPAGRVRLATTEILARSWLVAKLASLHTRFPRLELELITGTGLLNLLRRESDIALRVGKPGSEELIGRRAGVIAHGLYGSAAYLATHGEPQSLAELSHHTVIESLREIAELRQVRLLRQASEDATVSLRSNSVMAQLAAARAGLGLVTTSAHSARHFPELRRVLADSFDVRLDLWLLTHRDLRHNARIRAVLDFLAEQVRLDQAIFDPKNH